MRRIAIAPLAVAVGLALAMAGTAQAATKTASFNVTASVSKNCVISANPLALGVFDGSNDLNATSTIAVRCTSGTAYNVDLSQGGSGNFAARAMANGPDSLFYNLYTDTTYANVWGDGTASTVRVGGTGTGFAAATTLTVAGRLLAADNTGPIGAGNYTDTIVASIVY
jgi:spore coat protein U-like protein